MIKKNIANMITISRILGTLVMTFLDVLSMPFYLVYIWCGLSDVLDGFVARKTNTISALGSRLDSISDLLFYTVMMIKILPYLKMYLPAYVWVLIYTVLTIRALCYIYVGIKEKHFASRHTIFNKITGFLMFLLPFMVKKNILVIYSLLVLAVAYFSVFEEIFHLLRHR